MQNKRDKPGSSFSVDMACQAYGCLTRQGYGINKKNYHQVSFETGSFEMVFANQLVFITGKAFFYAEVGQPSQVELFLFHGNWIRVLVAVTNEIFKRESSKCILVLPRVERRGTRIATFG
jgi:hypothetical protein